MDHDCHVIDTTMIGLILFCFGKVQVAYNVTTIGSWECVAASHLVLPLIFSVVSTVQYWREKHEPRSIITLALIDHKTSFPKIQIKIKIHYRFALFVHSFCK